MKSQNNDYEQLYYDIRYENQKLKKENEELKQNLKYASKNVKQQFEIKKIILDELKKYRETKNEESDIK